MPVSRLLQLGSPMTINSPGADELHAAALLTRGLAHEGVDNLLMTFISFPLGFHGISAPGATT